HNLPVSVVGVKISKTGNYTILFTVSLIFIIAVFGVSLLTSICLIIYGIVKVQKLSGKISLTVGIVLLSLCLFLYSVMG
ncbi:hypothetical protein, partial [Yersinia pestis]|uniref:hypothetical protein n=1 Tax=Yersinia pestis TaxID=632 RepID=UPI0035A8465B